MNAAKKRRPYRSASVMQAEFDQLAEKLCARWGVLFGVERVTGYTDAESNHHPPAFNVHVDGLAFRVASMAGAIGVLIGFDAGRCFQDCGKGRGCATREEVRRIVQEELAGKTAGSSAEQSALAKRADASAEPAAPSAVASPLV